MIKKIESSGLLLRDIATIIAIIISVGSVVAYAHTTFANKDDLKEVRSMVYDLWRQQGLDRNGN